jgi:hypothetical protein
MIYFPEIYGKQSLDLLSYCSEQEDSSSGQKQHLFYPELVLQKQFQFEEQRDFPYKMVQYQKDLLQGLPVTTTASTTNQTQLSQLAGQVQGLMALYQSLANLGQTKPA